MSSKTNWDVEKGLLDEEKQEKGDIQQEFVELHPRRFHTEANAACNYREFLAEKCREFLSLKESMSNGWSVSNMAIFVFARNPDGSIILNEEGEYMFAAPDGQHRVKCQVCVV